MKTMRRLLVTTVVSIVALGSIAATAGAAGSLGPHLAPQCGYTMVDGGGLFAEKYATAIWPQVAAYNSRRGIVDRQYVYARFQWYERAPGSTSAVAAGNPEWRWTLASDAAYTRTWYTFNTNLPGQAVFRFAGYDATAVNPAADVFLHVSLYWYTGSTVTGSIGYWATNPNNVNNSFVCNGGGWIGSYVPQP